MAKVITRFSTTKAIRASRKSLNEAAEKIASQMATKIRRGIRGQSPPPSKPGARPHNDSGDLKRSIAATVTKRGVIRIESIHYGPFLESGTRRMAARPFVAPVIGKGKKRAWVSKWASLAKQIDKRKGRRSGGTRSIGRR